jgi:hypothetical protein
MGARSSPRAAKADPSRRGPAIALPRPVRFLDGYSNLSQATAWSVGEHWPTARDADVSFAAAARLMNVVGGKTRDAAMVKRLRSEGKIFAVHCGDYYPNRKGRGKTRGSHLGRGVRRHAPHRFPAGEERLPGGEVGSPLRQRAQRGAPGRLRCHRDRRGQLGGPRRHRLGRSSSWRRCGSCACESGIVSCSCTRRLPWPASG